MWWEKPVMVLKIQKNHNDLLIEMEYFGYLYTIVVYLFASSVFIPLLGRFDTYVSNLVFGLAQSLNFTLL